MGSDVASASVAAAGSTFAGVGWSVFWIFVLVLANGFFVASEFALVRVRNTQLDALAKSGSAAARLGMKLLAHLDAYLSATQLGITITSILLGWIGEPAVSKYVVGPFFTMMGWLPQYATAMHWTSIVLGTSIITLLHVVLGELMPKSIAIQKPEPTTLFCVYPLYFFYRAMYPIITTLNAIANFLLRQVGIHPASESEMAHTEEELRLLVDSSRKHGVISDAAQGLLENVFDLKETIIREITLPRNRVVAMDIRKPLSANLALAKRTAHSRYPLIDGDLDNVLGQVHIKDLFWKLSEAGVSSSELVEENPDLAGGEMAGENAPKDGTDFLRKIARRIQIVPETLALDAALRQFQQERIHFAMVVDEFGVATGMVTFENIIEAIVGEVHDEFDNSEITHTRYNLYQMADGYVTDGTTKIDEIDELFGTDLDDEEVDTVAGLFLREAGRLPKQGERVVVGDVIELTAELVEGLRIKTLRVRRIDAPMHTGSNNK